MPRPLVEGNELDRFALPVDEEMSRDLQRAQILPDPGFLRKRRSGEQRFRPRRSEDPRREADAVDEDQFEAAAVRTCVTVRRGAPADTDDSALRNVDSIMDFGERIGNRNRRGGLLEVHTT